MVDLVDVRDRVVGNTTIAGCLKEGLLHRAVAVLVLRSSGTYVLQQRSRQDSWQPGLWTISSTGHVKKGESYEMAAHRELREELGLEGELTPLRKYLLPPISEGGATEHEWVAFFTCRTDSPCNVNLAELEMVREVDDRELREMMVGGLMSEDSRTILSDYLSDP